MYLTLIQGFEFRRAKQASIIYLGEEGTSTVLHE